MELEILKEKKVAELREISAALGLDVKGLKKAEILQLLINMHEEAEVAKRESEAPKASEGARGKRAPKASRPVRESASKRNVDSSKSAAEESPSHEAESAGLSEKKAPSREADGAKAGREESSAREAETSKPDREENGRRENDGKYETTGILDIAEGGFGFLRFDNFLSSDADVYVSPSQIRRFALKTGDEIEAVCRRPVREKDEKFGAVLFVKTVNGEDPGSARSRLDFSELTPTYPNERIRLENGSSALSMRMADLIAPIGKGQRGLIVAPPKAGKTTLLKQIAKAIEKQNTGAELIVLLIDERPEEVTDMQESIDGRVIYSTFDEQPAHHVKVAEMVLARAQRLAEHGKDVIILLDSITRLARAYNLVEPPSGRTLSGGLDPSALYKPKKFFGAARNLKQGGSITILATALIETGSRMDDMIFEEFKGTGNMELHLDRNMAEKRIFPAINLNKSGTRREDLLLDRSELEGVWMIRRALSDWGPAEATERIVMQMSQSRSNRDFVERFRKAVI